jgi:hypothetical protein
MLEDRGGNDNNNGFKMNTALSEGVSSEEKIWRIVRRARYPLG